MMRVTSLGKWFKKDPRNEKGAGRADDAAPDMTISRFAAMPLN
jgi:hypothetical protein